MKIFKKRSEAGPYVTLDNNGTEEQADMDHEGAGRKESGLELTINIECDIDERE